METVVRSARDTRIGFHYYPDDHHYRESDLSAWLPILRALGASWLTVKAPLTRAIPEHFLRGLMANGIQPVLWFQPQLAALQPRQDWQLLFETYSRWGVQYTAVFNRPNLRTSWPARAWAQSDLVERFLDLYLPAADLILHTGLTPVFPPLEPGGDYWDTAFLRDCLLAMQRRGSERVLNHLVLGACAHLHPAGLEWGKGGPECWPGARAYLNDPNQQDQRGVYIFDWYQTITRAILGNTRPIILFELGRQTRSELDERTLAETNLMIAKRLALCEAEPELSGDTSVPQAFPQEVMAGSFWLLADQPESAGLAQAWFVPDGSPRSSAERLNQWVAESLTASLPASADEVRIEKPIKHYLLLSPKSGSQELDAIRAMVAQLRPTIGFSVEEAARASQVIIVGDFEDFAPGVIDSLQNAGCHTIRLEEVGTELATASTEPPTLDTNREADYVHDHA